MHARPVNPRTPVEGSRHGKGKARERQLSFKRFKPRDLRTLSEEAFKLSVRVANPFPVPERTRRQQRRAAALNYVVLAPPNTDTRFPQKARRTESQDDARSRSLAGAKHTDEIPSVGGSLRSISFAPADAMAALSCLLCSRART